MKVVMMPFCRTVKKLCWLLVLLPMVVFGCNQEAASTRAHSEQEDWVGEFAMIHGMKLKLCLNCETTEDVGRFEANLGSHRLKLSDGEIGKVFFNEPYARITQKDSLFSQTDLSGFDTTSVYKEIYLRPRTSDSIPNLAVLYNYMRPPTDLQSDSLRINDPYLVIVNLKFFFDDPVLRSNLGLADSLLSFQKFEPDSGDVSHYYGCLSFQCDSIFLPFTHKDFAKNPNYFEQNDAFLFQEGPYFFTTVDVSDFPPVPSSTFVDYEGTLALPRFRDMLRSTRWFKNVNGDETSRSTFVVVLDLGWSMNPDYYLRGKIVRGKRPYRLEVQPSDLAIFLSYSPR